MATVDTIRELQASGTEAIGAARELDELEALRLEYLGKKGSLTKILRGMGELPADERPLIGKAVNVAREALEEALAVKHEELSAAALDARIMADAIDVTLPARSVRVGHEHVISQIVTEIEDVFIGLGYSIADGPYVETEYYNFTSLNTPADHPSRSPRDTFYVNDGSGAAVSNFLLRTQTTPVQMRVMEAQKPPIYIICPGVVFRPDTADASHLPQFTQIEGLVVDKHITFADLKGTLDYFAHQMFGDELKTRYRPHFFPFTEPSAELDVSCSACGGKGCKFCKGEGWIEVLGCGMVDEQVLINAGIDPVEYSGFAFGIGAERVACLRYGLSDIRELVQNDMRFLEQF